MTATDATAGDRAVAPGAVTALLAELACAPEVPPPVAVPGARLGRFTLLRELGRGGFGVVFEARDEALKRAVALKLLAPRARGAGERWVAEEAEAAAQLQHPNLVSLFDVGSFEGSPWLVFELLEGETLARRLARGPMPRDEALDVVEQVACGVAHAHARGVLHRDLTPANVFLCAGGEVKILDFGLSRLVGGRAKRAATPGHAAPEQERGEPEDAATDVFALGVLAHECVTGALPGGDAAPPRWLAPLLARALRPEPADRPADGAEFLAALREARRRAGRARAWRRAGAVAAALALAAGVAALRAAPAAPVLVAIADVANEAGEPDLDALSGLLVTSLEQSRRVRVLTRTRLLDLQRAAGREPPLRLDGLAARDAARAAGAAALLAPRIHRFDDAYVVEVDAVEPRRDERLFTVRAQGRGRSAVPGLVDRVATQARLRLAEREAEVGGASVEVASAITANLEAYRHYFRGQDLANRGRPRAAMEEYREAVALDPAFTPARYELAASKLLNFERRSEVREEVADMARRLPHLPLKEALLVRALDAWSRDDLDGAIARYREVMERFPDDKWAPAMAGTLLESLADRPAEALPFLERALELDPGLELAMDGLLRALVALDRSGDALARARRWVADGPTTEERHVQLGYVHLDRGELPDAEAEARRAIALDRDSRAAWFLLETVLELRDDLDGLRTALVQEPPGSGAGLMRALLATAEGRWADARRELAASAPDAERVPRLRVMHVFLRAGVGPRDEFAGHARRYVAEVEDGVAVATVSAVLGELDLAREAIAATRTPRARVARALVEACAEVADGRPAAAVARLRTLRRADGRASPAVEYAIGAACRAAGDPACAADAFRRFRAAPRGPVAIWRAWAYPLALYGEAAARARLGERVAARELLDRLLARWRNADPDLPLLADARALRARLGD